MDKFTEVSSTQALVYLVTPALGAYLLYIWLSDPLRSIPGPFIAKFTKLYAILLYLAGAQASTTHELHKKYGPVVRLAPNRVAFASPRALKDIYNANYKFPKGPTYDSLGFRGMFTTRDRDNYRAMKKRIVGSFSQTAVTELEPVIYQQVRNLIKCFDKRVDAPLDVLSWFRMYALSVVGEALAGHSFGGLEKEEMPEVLKNFDQVFPTLWVWWMFPLLSGVLQYSPSAAVRKFLNAAVKFRKYFTGLYVDRVALTEKKDDSTLVGRMVQEQSALLEQDQPLPRHLTQDGIVDEVTNLTFAGTDTTGNTLAYLFWQLAHHSDWQARLREEITTATGNIEVPSYDTVSQLPILEAVVQESLRLHPAVSGALERIVPEGGGIIDGITLPAHWTIVTCQPLTVQRDATIFPEPDQFNPQRWIDAEQNGSLELLHDQMMVFGKGTRACLGQRMATVEVKCATAALVKRYRINIGSQTIDTDMEITDYMVTVPRGHRCELRLVRK